MKEKMFMMPIFFFMRLRRNCNCILDQGIGKVCVCQSGLSTPKVTKPFVKVLKLVPIFIFSMHPIVTTSLLRNSCCKSGKPRRLVLKCNYFPKADLTDCEAHVIVPRLLRGWYWVSKFRCIP
ncbi:hypothetical protein C5167_041871 [Papaver somniferum]|nr:hypothetical protein C5167_041871 [Papaver somniferum]